MSSSNVRQRKPVGQRSSSPSSSHASSRESSRESSPSPSKEKSPSESAKARARAEDDYSPWLDVARVLTFLLVASCGLSYVISGGESWGWSLRERPVFLQPTWWRVKLGQPIHLTLEQLADYDGRNPDKPLYLAINGTIYDVSKGYHMYGPGASYHAFAGHDAARAFVTTCIAEDNNPDLRGVERMFLPLDDPYVDSHWSAAEMASLRAEELEEARERAHSALKNWVDFFANSKKYHPVGRVILEEGWLDGQPVKELCAKAEKQRKKRIIPS